MGLQIWASNSTPRQAPVFNTIIAPLVAWLAQQWIREWPISQKVRAITDGVEGYPIVTWLHADINGIVDLWEDDEFLAKFSQKITLWIEGLSQLWWPPLVVALYHNFLQKILHESTQSVVWQTLGWIDTWIVGIKLTLKDPIRMIFGHWPTNFLHIDAKRAGEKISILEIFLWSLKVNLPEDQAKLFIEDIRAKALAHPDVIVAIETAMKVTALIQYGWKIWVLWREERDVSSSNWE